MLSQLTDPDIRCVSSNVDSSRVNIQFKGHLVSFGYSERIYALCGSEFF